MIELALVGLTSLQAPRHLSERDFQRLSLFIEEKLRIAFEELEVGPFLLIGPLSSFCIETRIAEGRGGFSFLVGGTLIDFKGEFLYFGLLLVRFFHSLLIIFRI